MRGHSKLIVSIVGISASIYFLICLGIIKWQNRLIFLPSRAMEATPELLDLEYAEVWLDIPGSKTDKIHGWWIPGKTDQVILYFHGNASNVSANIYQAERLQKLGFSVFLVDYRGYGKSIGKFPTEKQVYEDAEIALAYLLKQRKIQEEKIILFGHSLGGAIAINLATNHPNLAGAIIQSSFTSIADVARLNNVYNLLPLSLVVTQKFDSINKIAKLQMPLLFIHGKQDQLIPAFMSQQLYDKATAKKNIFFIPEAGHNDVAILGKESYLKSIQEFTQSLLIN